MTVREALDKTYRILAEEQTESTLTYASESASLERATNHLLLISERKERPRKVHEDPKTYKFRSTNFDLLVKILSQIGEGERSDFIWQLLGCVREPPAAVKQRVFSFPTYRYQTSALALVAEFSIRTGYLKELLTATQEIKVPKDSVAIMLMEIEEMIALNFNLFSDAELSSMPSSLSHLRTIAELQTYSEKGPPRGPRERNPHYIGGLEVVGREIAAAIDGITEECRKGRYFYLKGVLQELPNLEIESDKRKVEGFLVKLGFNTDMVKALDEAERDYKATATSFELKNCLGHLRSFLEHLHRHAARSIAVNVGTTVVDRWGDATLFLRQQGFFTAQHESFVTSLYRLLSDESVHPLTTDREYARLLRNVIIEYGVMFLTVLDKRGVKI